MHSHVACPRRAKKDGLTSAALSEAISSSFSRISRLLWEVQIDGRGKTCKHPVPAKKNKTAEWWRPYHVSRSDVICFSLPSSCRMQMLRTCELDRPAEAHADARQAQIKVLVGRSSGFFHTRLTSSTTAADGAMSPLPRLAACSTACC